MAPTLDRPDVPSGADLTEVRRLIVGLAARDGRDPLSDQALSHLASRGVEHAMVRDGDAVTGYAQLDGRSLEIAADGPALELLLDAFGGRPLLVWSHGTHSPLSAALPPRGFTAARELYQLRRPLDGPVDVPPVPDGVDIRAFAVGTDEDAWVAVNAAAFADHPEQGSWTRADLTAREGDAWFDPAGFLLAWRGDELLGYHWTKVHRDGGGEVYVIGMAPAAQGLGIGGVLLHLGLAYLRGRGCPYVLLYVDGDNPGARRLYARNGFVEHDLDVQWAAPAAQSSDGSVSNT